MARAIDLEVAPRDPREELRKRLEQAPEQHAEALLGAYEFLQKLHDSGVLGLLRGALASGDKIVETAVDAMQSDAGVRGLRNAMILGKMLSAINPDLLQGVAHALSETLGCRKPAVKPPGLLQLFAEFRQPELRRSMALINTFLEHLGEQLKTRGECQ